MELLSRTPGKYNFGPYFYKIWTIPGPYIGKIAHFDQLFDQNATGSAYVLPENGHIRQILKTRANSFKIMYHEPWVARRNLDSTGNMVEIESK